MGGGNKQRTKAQADQEKIEKGIHQKVQVNARDIR